jgi:tRNA A-37 threonylcarbamoyl transferase component Bud32
MNPIFLLPHLFFLIPHLSFPLVNSRVKHLGQYRIICLREEEMAEAKAFLNSYRPDGKESHFLKKGRRRQVSCIVSNEGKKVIKVHSQKKGRFRILRFLLPSKALIGYCLAQRLLSLGFPVPRHLMAIEKRWFPGGRESILVTEYLDGTEKVSKIFPTIDTHERKAFLKDLAQFTRDLHFTCFCHADLWAKNILVKGKHFYLLDLDGGYFSCKLLPSRAPVSLAQLLLSLNMVSPLSTEEVRHFFTSYGANKKIIERTIKAYNRKYGYKNKKKWLFPGLSG